MRAGHSDDCGGPSGPGDVQERDLRDGHPFRGAAHVGYEGQDRCRHPAGNHQRGCPEDQGAGEGGARVEAG